MGRPTGGRDTASPVSTDYNGASSIFTGRVELGADSFVYGTSDVEGVPSNIIIRVSGRTHPHKGDVLHVTTDPTNVHVFNTETGERLSA